ncbi:glycine cleavage system protein H [Mycolicibacterium moriokaense]|nr:glycine cleavage system protein H [Mycolicibacterium moriokaense]
MTTPPDVSGYELRLDRSYDPDTHLWVRQTAGGRVRVGLDALTADTYGALAQLEIAPIGTLIGRGETFGSLEAAKFVGPLMSPVSGLIADVNESVLADPDLVLREPYDGGWLLEFAETTLAPGLLTGDEAATWFAGEVAGYREKGLLAE